MFAGLCPLKVKINVRFAEGLVHRPNWPGFGRLRTIENPPRSYTHLCVCLVSSLSNRFKPLGGQLLSARLTSSPTFPLTTCWNPLSSLILLLIPRMLLAPRWADIGHVSCLKRPGWVLRGDLRERWRIEQLRGSVWGVQSLSEALK